MRDKANWKGDAAADLERLADKSWIYPHLWRLQAEQGSLSHDDQLRELQRPPDAVARVRAMIYRTLAGN